MLPRVLSLRVNKPETFDFHFTAAVYNFHWHFDGKSLYLAFPSEQATVLRVRDKGRELEIAAYSEQRLGKDQVHEAVEHALGLSEDLDRFYERLTGDRLLSYAAQKMRGFRVRSVGPWVAVMIAICQQRASFIRGWKMLYRIYESLGRPVTLEGGDSTILPPSPSIVLNRQDVLPKLSLGFRVSALVSAARAFVEGEIALEDPDSFEADLRALRGVGQYTARLARVLGLRSYENPPIDDWTVKVVAEAYGVKPRQRDVEEFLVARYGDYAGLAVLLYTVVLDAEPLTRALERIRKGLVSPSEQASKPTPLSLWKFVKF